MGSKKKTGYTFKSVKLETMPSGHLYLKLSNDIDWEDVPTFAAQLVESLGGIIVSHIDLPDARMCEIEIANLRFDLVFEDYPQMVSLESRNDNGDQLLRSILDKIRNF